MFTRSQLKKIAVDVLSCNESKTVKEIYLTALRFGQYEEVEYIRSLGRDARQQISNYVALSHAKKFGYNSFQTNAYGWANAQVWELQETIQLRQKEDRAICNEIRIGVGANKKYTYGLSYNFGTGAGGGWNPSYYGTPYDTRETCLSAALSDLEEKMLDAIRTNQRHNDPANFKPEYMQKILTSIKELRYSQVNHEVQLSLF